MTESWKDKYPKSNVYHPSETVKSLKAPLGDEMIEPAVYKTYELFTYKHIWDETKKKYNLTDEELRNEIEESLQMWAWSDIITESVEYHLKNIERVDKG
jgi:hypothetical protein